MLVQESTHTYGEIESTVFARHFSKMELHFDLPKDSKGDSLQGEEDSDKDELKSGGKDLETIQMDTSGGDIIDKALMKISTLDNWKKRCIKCVYVCVYMFYVNCFCLCVMRKIVNVLRFVDQLLVRSCCYQNVASLTTILDEWAGLLCVSVCERECVCVCVPVFMCLLVTRSIIQLHTVCTSCNTNRVVMLTVILTCSLMLSVM